MSKRYGRNQKRAAREKIAALTDKLADARNNLLNAEERAFETFVQEQGFMRMYVERIGEALGRELASELRPIAQQILNAQANEEPFSLTLGSTGGSHSVRTIKGQIRSLSYNVALYPGIKP